jgi:hypothetical protein
MVSTGIKSVLVHQVNSTKLCAYCNLDLNIEEGVMIYDKNWYHNDCWGFYENQKEVVRND